VHQKKQKLFAIVAVVVAVVVVVVVVVGYQKIIFRGNLVFSTSVCLVLKVITLV